jgi:hypothetical protein
MLSIQKAKEAFPRTIVPRSGLLQSCFPPKGIIFRFAGVASSSADKLACFGSAATAYWVCE